MPFPIALRNFYTNGFFELTDAQIFLDNIHDLTKRIKHLKEDKPEISFYQIHLNNINLIPGTLPPTEMAEHILNGTIVEHSPRSWNEKLTDVALAQMMGKDRFNAPLNIRNQEENPEKQLIDLKKALFSLLGQSDTWSSIELDNVFFYIDHQINHAATQDFYNELLGSLAKNNSLRELSIKPFSLTKQRTSLINFLTQHAQLESLYLEITEGDRQDWLELSQILAMHPKLNSLNLGNSILDANAYSALASVLDENYHIEITLPEPTDEDLLKAYEPLKQRLSKPGLERFKEDHLSQAKLLQLALKDLESQEQTQSEQFNFLLTNQGHLAITDRQKESWTKSTEILPSIYKRHKEYLKNESSLVQLHVDELVDDGSKTIGYVLLEKALETKNLGAMQTLLNAKADLFELPNNEEEPFLVQVLQSKGDLKKIVVEHIRRDQRLAELASECLTAYPDLSHTIGDLKTHLDHYSSHLVKRDNPYTLLSISNEVLVIWRKLLGFQNPATTRGKECAQIYLDLDKSLQIINDAPGVTYTALREVQIIMQKIKENSTKALRGILNKSLLHEEVVNLVDQFNDKLEASKDHINGKKDETIKHKDEEIKKLKESHEKEKSLFNEKCAEMEVRQAETEAKLAETEAKRVEMETENAEIKARQAAMEETINKLLQVASNNSHTLEERTLYDQTAEARGFFRP